MRKLHKKSKLLFGVGINDADYVVCPTVNGKEVRCPYYRVWNSMLCRCYSEKYQQQKPSYIGCLVDERWHSFMTFKAWMMTQDWQGNALDKDYLGNGKLYSPETCRFIPRQLNSLFNDCGISRGDLTQGVSKLGKGYLMSLSINGRLMQKYYHTVDEASKAYITAKEAHVRSKYALLDEALIQGCERHLAYIRHPLLKLLCH